ncbi:Target of rapamycin complex 2 subunit avo2 [Mucor circinelloides]
MILNTHHEKTVPFCSFFDLPRAAIIRDTPSVRLRKAAKEGNIAAVKRLLRKVSNIQNPDPETGCTTLMYATQFGHVDLVELLLELGHEEEVISVDNEGITVLMIAAMFNHEEIFFLYVSKYPECIHAISKNGWTALLYAAQNGNANLVSYLLSISADFDHIDNLGNSALHYASAWGHITVMDLLVSEGCNVDLENDEHATAYDYAYSTAVQEHLKEISQIPFNDDSTLSVSSSQRQQSLINAPYSSSYSSGIHLGLTSMAISRGQSYAGHESPVPRASTSSSSLVIPSVTTPGGGPLTASSSPRGSHYQQPPIGSPSSFSELERRRASSFGDAKQKGYRP